MNQTGDTLLSAYNGIPAYRMRGAGSAPSTLPVGKGTSYTLTLSTIPGIYAFTGTGVSMNVNSNSASMPVVVSRLNLGTNPNTPLPQTTFPALQGVFNDKYWVINAFAATTFDLNITYEGIAGVLPADQTTPSNLKLVRRASRGTGAWGSLTSAFAYTPATQAITINSISGFSQTALGTTSSPPLPVEQLSLTATPLNTEVQLDWTTQQEANNWGFFVEMQRPSSAHFEGVGFVNGNNTTQTPSHYRFRVPDLSPGTYHFRLRQVDFDGNYAFSEVVEATLVAPANSGTLRVFPNPSAGSFTVACEGATGAHLRVVNMLGQEVWLGTLNTESQSLSLELPAGIYTLQAQTPDGRLLTSKIEIVQR
jgi:hypothetical protein